MQGDSWLLRIELKKVIVMPDWDGYEAAVDDAIATCDGDLRGALKALIIVNEYLERDLNGALALATAAPSIAAAADDDAGLMLVNWMEVRKLARMSTGKL
jgi:hypothetical protein